MGFMLMPATASTLRLRIVHTSFQTSFPKTRLSLPGNRYSHHDPIPAHPNRFWSRHTASERLRGGGDLVRYGKPVIPVIETPAAILDTLLAAPSVQAASFRDPRLRRRPWCE
jgi:hypothetical protein